MDLAGRNVVVTGGTGALGEAVTGLLLGAGAVCHIPNLIAAELETFAHAGHADVRLARGIDLADADAVAGYFDGIGPLWASIHLAGGFAMGAIEESPAALFDDQIAMNARTCYLCCRAAVGAIRRTGAGGRIVNVAARPGIEPRQGAGMIAYTAAKAAVAAITQALAEEVAGEAIWVNAVAPSILNTPANRAAMPDAAHQTWPATAAVAGTIVFLASPDNQVTRGAVVPVYGAF